MVDYIKTKEDYKDTSYLLIPFDIDEAVDVEKSFKAKWNNISPRDIKNDLLIGYVEEIIKKSTGYNMGIPENIKKAIPELSKMVIHFFKTGIGFVILKYNFDPNKELSDKLESINKIREALKNSNIEDSNIITYLKKIQFINFHKGNNNVLTLNFFTGKVSKKEVESYYSFDDSEVNLFDMYSDEITVYTDLLFNAVAEKQIEFRNKYEESLLLMYMLLHHERQLYLKLRTKVVTKDEKISNIKTKLLEMLTEYSFDIVSDDADFQELYERYKEILKLSNYEDTVSELVYKINDEMESKKEKRMNILEFIIAAIGVLQIISVVLDVIGFVSS